jgi:hypothetical protein
MNLSRGLICLNSDPGEGLPLHLKSLSLDRPSHWNARRA